MIIDKSSPSNTLCHAERALGGDVFFDVAMKSMSRGPYQKLPPANPPPIADVKYLFLLIIYHIFS